MARVHTEGNGGKHKNASAVVPGLACCFPRNIIALDRVGGIREVVIVGLCGAPGQDGHLMVGVPEGLPVGPGEQIRRGVHLEKDVIYVEGRRKIVGQGR